MRFLPGGGGKPLERFFQILRDSHSSLIHDSHVVLAVGLSLLRGGQIQIECFF